MGTIGSNRKCKECKWFDGRCCTEPERNRINKEKGWDYYRNFRRLSYEPACKSFEEKEDNMTQKEFDKTIKAMDKNISDMAKLMDKMDELIESLPDDFKDIKEEEPVEKKKTTNKYNIGDVVYIPFKIKGMEARVIKTEDTWGKDPEYKTDIVYKLTRPLTIDNVTRGDLNKKERSDGPYWKCFAMDTITQESLEAIQEDLK